MPKPKIGIQLASFKLPMKQALPRAARLGAQGVELDARREFHPRDLTQTGVRQLRKWLSDYELNVCAVRFRTRHGYNVSENLQGRIDATKEALAAAYALGSPVVINQVGYIPEDPNSPEWGLLVEALTDLGRFSQRAGAWLAIETGAESGPHLARLIQALPDGSVGVNFDPGSLIINGFSVTEALQALGPYIMHVQARDGVRDLAQGRGLEVPLGRGSVDFPSLLATLDELNYRGYLTVERRQSEDPVADIEMAVQYLRNVSLDI